MSVITPNFEVTIEDLIKAYNLLVQNIEEEAHDIEGRAFGGVIRAGKGKLVESMTMHMVSIAWKELKKERARLMFSRAKIAIPIQQNHLTQLPDQIRNAIGKSIDEYIYKCKVDVHVMVDGKLAVGIECKSYTENAMLKRILVDFMLLKSKYPDLSCILMQLESQLGGDYSNPSQDIVIGSKSTRTLESYFPSVKMNIITLLEGERKVNQPIHEPNHFKSLAPHFLQKAIENLKEILSVY